MSASLSWLITTEVKASRKLAVDSASPNRVLGIELRMQTRGIPGEEAEMIYRRGVIGKGNGGSVTLF